MKTLLCLLLVLVMVFTLSTTVLAQHRGGRGGGHWGGGRSGYWGGRGHWGGGRGGYWGGRGYWGARGWWGYPYWWDYSYYPYYYPYSYPYYDPYYYGGYGEPPVPPQGVTPPAESGQQQPSYWHFCRNPEGYYPYVKDCPGGWMTVVPPKPNATPPRTLGSAGR